MSQTKLRRPYTNNSFRKQVEKFRKFIKDVTYSDCELTSEYRRQGIAENLPYNKFSEKLRRLFGPDVKSKEIKVLYRKITSNPEAPVDWGEVFGISDTPFKQCDDIYESCNVFDVNQKRTLGNASGNRRKRDILQVIHYTALLDCYVTASQNGVISVWNSQLCLLHTTFIQESCWVTGCIYLPNLRRIAISTDRSLFIIDSKGKSQNIVCIKHFTNSPQCLTLASPQDEYSTQDVILMGDDQGYITMVTIITEDLMKHLSKEQAGKAFKVDIPLSSLSHPVQRRKFHDDWILKLSYVSELNSFISCSPSSLYSLLLEPITKIASNELVVPVSVPKGVNTFVHCKTANIIATAGVDTIIRIWQPPVFTRTIGKLVGHMFTLNDICCNEREQHIISLSTARAVRVWDIHTFLCLQVFSASEQRRQGTLISCMFYDEKYQRLLTGSDIFAVWPRTRNVEDSTLIPRSHDSPINQVLYSSELNQVVTVCKESTLKVWEHDSGDLVYQIPNAHGLNIEITSLAVEDSGYRLASGASDGSLLIWDIGSGKWCKRMPCAASSRNMKISMLIYFAKSNERMIVGLGWNDKVKIILDSSDSNQLLVLKEIDQHHSVHSSVSAIIQTPDTPSNFEQTQHLYETTEQQMSSEHKSVNVSCLSIMSPEVIILGYSNGCCVISDMLTANVKAILTKQCQQEWRVDNEVTMIKVLVYRENQVKRTRPLKVTISSKFPKRRSSIGPVNQIIQFRDSKNSDQIMSDLRKMSMSIPSADGGSQDSRLGHFPPGFTKHTLWSQLHQPRDSPLPRNGNTGSQPYQPPDSPLPHNFNTESQPLQTPDSPLPHNGNTGPQLHQTPASLSKNDTTDCVIVVICKDNSIRFWNANGQLLTKLKPVGKHNSESITCLCHDNHYGQLYAGDNAGYLTLWNITKFLQTPNTERKDAIIQEVRWRAHLSTVTSLSYISKSNTIISGSTDNSVRLWWGTGGRYVGFFGQPSSFNFPATEDTNEPSVLPCDITEFPQRTVTGHQKTKLKRNVQNLEYPLVFNNERWKPSSEDIISQGRETRDHPVEKFFTALAKPQGYRHHLEVLIQGQKEDDAVYRSLPIYRLQTPQVVHTPELTRSVNEDGGSNMHTTRYIKRTAKGRLSRRSSDVKGFKHMAANYGPNIRRLSRLSFDIPSRRSSDVFSKPSH